MEQHAVIKFEVDELTHVVRISAIEGVREIESMVKVPWGRGKKCTMLDATILHIDRFAECRRFQDAYDEMMNASESPDLNPIENFWHKLKNPLRIEVMPRTYSYFICIIFI